MSSTLETEILDLAVDHVLDGQRVDGAGVLLEELVDQLRGVGEGGVDHRQVLLRRRQDDEAAVDLVGVEILVVAEFLGDLRREAGAVDLEGFQLRRLQPEGDQRLVVALDQMRLVDRQQPAVDQLVVAQEVHLIPSPRSRREGARMLARIAPQRSTVSTVDSAARASSR